MNGCREGELAIQLKDLDRKAQMLEMLLQCSVPARVHELSDASAVSHPNSG